MGASLGGDGGGPMADINVTPLIDVVLVLLVVFMVITPMLESGKNVELPVSTQARTVKDTGQHVVVSITADGTWWVQSNEASADTLRDLVFAEKNMRMDAQKANPATADRPPMDPPVLVKADRSLTYRQVRELLDTLARNDITYVRIATAKES